MYTAPTPMVADPQVAIIRVGQPVAITLLATIRLGVVGQQEEVVLANPWRMPDFFYQVKFVKKITSRYGTRSLSWYLMVPHQ